MLTLIVLSCSVAADATAVSIAASVRGINAARGLAMAAAFGVAQAVMAGLGWAGGALFGELWSAWDHWVALVLLAGVGVKMIREAFAEERAPATASAGSIALLAIATSLDALAVGVSLPALRAPALLALTMIGAVTFLFSAA
ncbi:MAG TPA: manganese efflux pump, partial [Thermoanaerobaculia bacterium]|nr:manganese efflux pump [Thermoanaerobaculia bacterium]